jgi:hypothetical protein
MSQANASAIKRRAGLANAPVSTTTQQQQSGTQSTTGGNGLTLQQVISLLDKRLIAVEQFTKEKKEEAKAVSFQSNVNQEETPLNNNLNEILDEFNNRFLLLAQEMGELKDIVLKLQSYTMEVNKSLFNERIKILSDLGNFTTDNEIESSQFTVQNNDSGLSGSNDNLIAVEEI